MKASSRQRITCHLLAIATLILPCPCNSEPIDAAQLWQEIAAIRHYDLAGATKLAEDAYLRSPQFSAAWRWRFRVRHAELLLDPGMNKSNGDARRGQVLAEIEALKKQPLPAGLPADEAAARLASLAGYFPYRVTGDEKQAEAFFEKAVAKIAAVRNDPCWEAELRVHHQAQTLQGLGRYSEALESADWANSPPMGARTKHGLP